MDNATREAMNAKLDILFNQIERLEGDKLEKATYALKLWRSAKMQESIGLGPMEARAVYKVAFDALNSMGLETGGMIKPYEDEREKPMIKQYIEFFTPDHS